MPSILPRESIRNGAQYKLKKNVSKLYDDNNNITFKNNAIIESNRYQSAASSIAQLDD